MTRRVALPAGRGSVDAVVGRLVEELVRRTVRYRVRAVEDAVYVGATAGAVLETLVVWKAVAELDVFHARGTRALA